MKYLLVFMLFLGACANRVEVPKDVNTHADGRVDININFGFLDQIRQLCEDEYALAQFESDPQHRKIIADCINTKLSLLNSSTQMTAVVNNGYCQPGADLSRLSHQELAQLGQICALLNP